MKVNAKFYKCQICGNVIGLIDGNIEHINCCGQAMELLEANTTDAAKEKHIPVYERSENEIVVKVGSTQHPMEKEHYIAWVGEMTDNTTVRVRLFPEQEALVRLPYIKGAKLFAYCNKHGLWSTEVE